MELMPMEKINISNNSPSDIKELYRFIYSIVKQIDEQKSTIISINEVFAPKLQHLREQLITHCELLIFQNHEIVGKKSRELIWRKGYYDLITIAKRLWLKGSYQKYEEKLKDLITEGIKRFKNIVLKLEHKYNLNLKYIIDFDLLYNAKNSNIIDRNETNQTFSLSTINYALETTHSFLLSLGDLHRYYVDFNFNDSLNNNFTNELIINRNIAAQYYFEAFKLNSNIGMPQNQLGTLYNGQNHNFDSMYHYLYSLTCPQPFELSENNVNKIFQTNSEYLESITTGTNVKINVRDFLAQFILIVDIFFYDKNITDFNLLCHCVLVDFRKLLQSNEIPFPENDFLLKSVSTLLFSMVKLKSIDSLKVYSLNAFLMAICSELVDACTIKLEQFIVQRTPQNENFKIIYEQLFNKYDNNVRQSKKIVQKSINDTMFNTNCVENSTNIDDENKSQISPVSEKLIAVSQQFQNKNVLTNDDHNKQISDANISSKPVSLKGKKQQSKLRRRRKKLSLHNSDSDLTSFDEDSDDDKGNINPNFDDDIDSDFSSESDDVSFENSYESSDVDYDSDGENASFEIEKHKEAKSEPDQMLLSTNSPNVDLFNYYSDTDDIVVEEEKIVYLNETGNKNNGSFSNSNSTNELIAKLVNIDLLKINNINGDDYNDDDKDVIIEEEIIVYNNKTSVDQSTSMKNIEQKPILDENSCIKNSATENTNDQEKCQEKLRYKRKYSKIDPNIIIEFATIESNILKALKILFDWLKVNNEILINCFVTNPEFIHKIIKLLNYFNIDIFTNKVYFDRSLIEIFGDKLRHNLRFLFDNMNIIPISEDTILKNFTILNDIQKNLDWEAPINYKLTINEQHFCRIFKLVDFGFFMCKMKKFRYSFCARSRQFIEIVKIRNDHNKPARKKFRDKKKRTFSSYQKIKNEHHQNNVKKHNIEHRDNSIDKTSNSVEFDKKNSFPKKSYLKNRNSTIIESNQLAEKENLSSTGNKYEIMGKLWLRSEVKTLETKIKKPAALTPFLVMDTKSLTDYSSIVKYLMKSREFIILIPTAVIAELDQLKKCSEGARKAIRWLEKEFSKGNRFLRPQRNHETLAIPFLKIPKKLDREEITFLKIAEFCNYLQKHHTMDNETSAEVLTVLTGEMLSDRKSSNLSFTGVIKAILVNYDQISMFYSKYKKK